MCSRENYYHEWRVILFTSFSGMCLADTLHRNPYKSFIPCMCRMKRRIEQKNNVSHLLRSRKFAVEIQIMRFVAWIQEELYCVCEAKEGKKVKQFNQFESRVNWGTEILIYAQLYVNRLFGIDIFSVIHFKKHCCLFFHTLWQPLSMPWHCIMKL